MASVSAEAADDGVDVAEVPDGLDPGRGGGGLPVGLVGDEPLFEALPGGIGVVVGAVPVLAVGQALGDPPVLAIVLIRGDQRVAVVDGVDRRAVGIGDQVSPSVAHGNNIAQTAALLKTVHPPIAQMSADHLRSSAESADGRLSISAVAPVRRPGRHRCVPEFCMASP